MAAMPALVSSRHACGVLLVACCLLAPAKAMARTVRPLFEPTDLEMEPLGQVELDLQFGGIRSRGPWRVIVPDFELDIGLLPYLELDIDGAYAVEGPSKGSFAFDHAAPDSLWTCLKLVIYDRHDGVAGRGFALGIQAGPKFPVGTGAHGIGVELLLLMGYFRGQIHTILNLGGFVDPAPAGSGRPVGLEAGLDLGVDLDDKGRFSFACQLSGVRFVSDDPPQLLATAGLRWAAMPSLDISFLGLLGMLEGSDRYGFLVGFAPKLQLFGGATNP